jgi:all-trans-retinol dehydrogenase (NAD+)
MRDLRGKRLLITGAGHGIGRSQALRFAREGAQIIATDINDENLKHVAEEIRAVGGSVCTYLLDVTDDNQIRAVRQQLLDDGGPIDILINNAGIVFGGPFLEVPLERHQLTYDINTKAVAAVTYVFLPDLIERPESHIVFIASASGFVGLPFGTTYASSKWAAVGLAEGIRLEMAELGHKHIGVTCVCPGYINTGMFSGVGSLKGMKMLTPERLADQVVSSVKRSKAFLITPLLAHSAPMMRGLAPIGVLDFVARFFGVSTSMLSWRGHKSDAPDQAAKVDETTTASSV